jgi:hypothetical protein
MVARAPLISSSGGVAASAESDMASSVLVV